MIERNVQTRWRRRDLVTGFAASAFVVLFFAGLAPVTMIGGRPYFPGPASSIVEVQDYFIHHPGPVLLCAFLHFGSAIALGLFTTQVISDLKHRKAAGSTMDLILFSGITTAITILVASCVLWTATNVEISQNVSLLFALSKIQFALGGPGFSVPFGLLVGSISIAVSRERILPRWLVAVGFAIFFVGELSWLEILTVKFIFLIPLTRFPGFVWMILASFRLKSMGDA